MSYSEQLLSKIYKARERSILFFESLQDKNAVWQYTATHDIKTYPSATLYGTWSGILGLTLLGETKNWSNTEKGNAIQSLCVHRRKDRSFLGTGLELERNSKSFEYLILHCTNYSLGAALEIDPSFDFETPYLHRFLDGDFLDYWLGGRSFLRPWEEGNNIVNVASYLALCNEYGVPKASDRLLQLLEWHKRHQNPKTGGFDCFKLPTHKQNLESLAGAVHNFHLYLYLNQPFCYEEVIANALPRYLWAGRLTACLSIDFVELAIRTLSFSSNPQELVWALLSHTEVLLDSQRDDGGWLEADNDSNPTSTAGFQDSRPSSCSYATWFRLASLGMVSIVLLNDDPTNWKFRNTLGMGYAPLFWPKINCEILVDEIPYKFKIRRKISSFSQKFNQTVIRAGYKYFGK